MSRPFKIRQRPPDDPPWDGKSIQPVYSNSSFSQAMQPKTEVGLGRKDDPLDLHPKLQEWRRRNWQRATKHSLLE